MATEQILYAQVVMLCRKDLNITEENENKNEAKFKLQGQSTRSQRWFDLYFDWIEEMFSTQKHYFYRKIYQRNDEIQDTNTSKIFEVPIGNKNVRRK